MQATPPPEAAAGAAFAGVFIVIWLAMAALMVVAVVFWIIALVDVCRRDFPGQNDRQNWGQAPISDV